MASAAYERRNARARALGYSSYYDYRAHGNGRTPPDAPRLTGQALARARGHTGAADLERSVRAGDLVTATPDPTSRRDDGSYSRFYVTVVGADGREREYLIRNTSAKDIDKLVAAVSGAGAIFSPSPSLDLRRVGREHDEHDDEDEADLEGEDDYEYTEDDIPF